jgi:uncharacterized surface protein with fasciclin (FAS1) repeats
MNVEIFKDKRFIIITLVAVLVGLFSATLTSAQSNDQGNLARVRFVHLAPDMPLLQIWVNGSYSGYQFLKYGDVSGWAELPAGEVSFAFIPAGSAGSAGLSSAIVGPVEVDLPLDGWVTLAITGSMNAIPVTPIPTKPGVAQFGTLKTVIIEEEYELLENNTAFVTIMHALENAPIVDILAADGSVLISKMEYGDSESFTLPAGTYNLQVVATGTTTPVLLTIPTTTLNADTYNFVAVANGTTAPQVVAGTVTEKEVAPLFGKVNRGSLTAVIANDRRFDTLEAAIDAAGLTSTLNGAGPITVFAPTDDAFDVLLTTLGITEADLLANPTLLTSILRYHVADGFAPISNLTLVNAIPTLENGRNIRIQLAPEGGIILNDTVHIIVSDIYASNGVIHVLDAVLMP